MVKHSLLLPYSAKEEIADFSSWNAKAFYFHDNNGNILELITHYDWLATSAGQFFSTHYRHLRSGDRRR